MLHATTYILHEGRVYASCLVILYNTYGGGVFIQNIFVLGCHHFQWRAVLSSEGYLISQLLGPWNEISVFKVISLYKPSSSSKNNHYLLQLLVFQAAVIWAGFELGLPGFKARALPPNHWNLSSVTRNIHLSPARESFTLHRCRWGAVKLRLMLGT
jgi:hypothetical protein